MKRKKGFTLIELLAVIVILAIIALIATPIILNMIENSKKQAAISSSYGYIESIENYQVLRTINGEEALKEGKYDILKDNINNLLKVKGKKASAGELNITKSGNVGSAILCINGYLIDYQNSTSVIISDDCDDIGLAISYNINSIEWEKNKTIEIEYPENKNLNYLKVLSGKALLNNELLELNKEIKVSGNVELKIEENSEIEVWIQKDNVKKYLRKIIVSKIDNIELKKPSATIEKNYPVISLNGIYDSSKLEINYEKQEGTSPYYSIDDGKTWIKYDEKTSIMSNSAKVKLMRNESKFSSEIVTATEKTSTITDMITSEAFDGDENTSVRIGCRLEKRIALDESIIGKTLSVSVQGNDNYLRFYDKDNNRIFEKDYSNTTAKLVIPENAVYFADYESCKWSEGIISEISLANEPVINTKLVYPLIKKDDIDEGYVDINISYFETSIKMKYSYDNEEWLDYKGKIELPFGKTIYAKGIDKNNKETKVVSYTSSNGDALLKAAFDGDENTSVRIGCRLEKRIALDESIIGKTLSVSVQGNDNYLRFYDKDNNRIFEKDYSNTTAKLVIPENAVYFADYESCSWNKGIITEIKLID